VNEKEDFYMKRNWMGAAALLLLTACGGGSSGGGSRNFSAIGTTLDGFVASTTPAPSGQVDGYSFALSDNNGTLYEVAGGNQSVDSNLAIASATKLPSAIAILTLVDAGKLDLDTPVGTYLSQFDPTFNWPPANQSITMRMLLSHTAGIRQSSASPSDCLNDTTTTLRACAQDIANSALDSTPGSTFSYTGADYQIAGYVAVLVARAGSWQTLFANSVATPLGLTTFSYGITLNPRIAGGAVSNVDDYVKILRLILRDGVADDGTRILSHTMVQALETSQIGNATFDPASSLPGGTANYFSGYTFGLFITAPSQYANAGTPGPEFSDPGLYGATPWFDTGKNYAAIILINQDTVTGLNMLTAVRPVVVTALQ
jgi:CubicO group peptidase (beta-lactamase class C family)